MPNPTKKSAKKQQKELKPSVFYEYSNIIADLSEIECRWVAKSAENAKPAVKTRKIAENPCGEVVFEPFEPALYTSKAVRDYVDSMNATGSIPDPNLAFKRKKKGKSSKSYTIKHGDWIIDLD